jgi:acyl-CoA thioesterase-1
MSIKNDVGYMGLCVVAGLMISPVLAGCRPTAKDKALAATSTDTTSTPAGSALQSDSLTAKPRSTGPVVLFIGTSLTAGLGLPAEQAYPALIQKIADSAGIRMKAVNAGVSGETSAGALNRIDWVLRGPADIVVLETGANDALRALPVSEARTNISRILDRIKAAKPEAKLFLIQMEAPPNLGQQYTSAFHDMYGELAREKDATLIPFLLDGVAGHRELNQADGLHPNIRGERIVAHTVWDALKPALR